MLLMRPMRTQVAYYYVCIFENAAAPELPPIVEIVTAITEIINMKSLHGGGSWNWQIICFFFMRTVFIVAFALHFQAFHRAIRENESSYY
ncbi:MAG TPA: hypothetical protein PLR69_08750, partial [Candidatus Limiplasma sp.]|nr:hypothetical protein [Candidatus Limiplasma sp.]